MIRVTRTTLSVALGATTAILGHALTAIAGEESTDSAIAMIHNSLPGMSIEEITTVIQNLAEQENRPAREVALDQARIAVNAQTKAVNRVTATPRSSSNGSDNRSAFGSRKAGRGHVLD